MPNLWTSTANSSEEAARLAQSYAEWRIRRRRIRMTLCISRLLRLGRSGSVRPILGVRPNNFARAQDALHIVEVHSLLRHPFRCVSGARFRRR